MSRIFYTLLFLYRPYYKPTLNKNEKSFSSKAAILLKSPGMIVTGVILNHRLEIVVVLEYHPHPDKSNQDEDAARYFRSADI